MTDDARRVAAGLIQSWIERDTNYREPHRATFTEDLAQAISTYTDGRVAVALRQAADLVGQFRDALQRQADIARDGRSTEMRALGCGVSAAVEGVDEIIRMILARSPNPALVVIDAKDLAHALNDGSCCLHSTAEAAEHHAAITRLREAHG